MAAPWDGTVRCVGMCWTNGTSKFAGGYGFACIAERSAARAGSSKVPRIVPIEGGVTGDPWSPVVAEKTEVR